VGGRLRLRLLRAHGGLLLLGDGGAALAHAAALVPARLRAHPVAAAPALAEQQADLGDRPAQRGIVSGSAHRLLDLVRAVARLAKHAPEDAARAAQECRRDSDLVGLEGRHVTITAALAVELE